MPKDSNCFPSDFTTSLPSIRTTGGRREHLFHGLEIRNGNSVGKFIGKSQNLS